MTSVPWARCDDLRAGRAVRFPPARDVLTATRPDEVADVLRAAERATRAGRWAFGFVSYEAGLVLQGRPAVTSPPGLPLVWFGVGDAPTEVAPVAPRGGVGYRTSGWAGGTGRAEHAVAVGVIRDHVAAGDVYQVNLTGRWHTDVEGDLDALYADLATRQRGAYSMFVDTGRFAVLSASPELFVERRGDDVVMRPMKGTTRRGRDLAEDAALVAALRTSEKDRAENVMIVDLVRNDLARVATTGSVSVRSLCAVERFETVHQLTSEVVARLRPEVDLVELFTAVFPSGSVTGAPKRRAMQVVDEVEPGPRGIYCGAVGFLAPATEPVRLRFNVAIRTAVVDRATGTATYGSGGGITWASDAGAEYEEMLAKTAVLDPAPADPALLETMRSEADGTIAHLDRHLARLAASAAYLGYGHDDELVRKTLHDAVPTGSLRRVRLTLDRSGHVGVVTTALPAPAGSPVRLAVDTDPVDRASPWLRHKTTHRAVYDDRRARHPDVDDVVLVNAQGEITETTIAAVLVRLGESWWTPPLDSGCLPGVGRGVLLDRGEVAERVLTVAELVAADELAVVSALRGRRPAVLVPGPPAAGSG